MQSDNKDYSLVLFHNGQGLETRAAVVRLERHKVVFEVYSAQDLLRKSEVLDPFTILVHERPIYSGTAVLTNVVDTGLMLVCEARLDESGHDLEIGATGVDQNLDTHLRSFLERWQKFYRIGRDYKVVIADIHSFLVELHNWLQQVEIGVRSHPANDRVRAELDTVKELEGTTVACLTELFQKFEVAAEAVPVELGPVHDAFARRHLHPFILTAPFAFRTFHKPLGYAGDYEMVNMMTRPPYEGGSLFAKLFNCWLLQQAPAEAHRNRISYLLQTLRQETARVHATGRRIRLLSLGCGPAVELQQLVEQSPLSNECEATLIDFNQETLLHTQAALETLVRRHARSMPLSFARRTVHQIIKDANRTAARPPEQSYDLVYCAGLFDYISDGICQRLISVLYDWLGPGGLLLCTNVAPQNPFKHCMETFLDWHLAYRGGPAMKRFLENAPETRSSSVKSDLTGVNILLEMRKF
jgi:extracellular factor (EF) 3-hydroxypalmitic acid methyl ester biosynthesis protein